MSISERVPGKTYRFRCMHKGNSYDKTFYGTKRQAEKAHEKWLQDVKNGVIISQASSGESFTEIYEMYKSARNLSPASIKTYNEAIKRLGDDFWSSDMNSITKKRANEIIISIKNSRSEVASHETHKFLKSLYNYCIEDLESLSENPFAFKSVKPKSKLNKKDELIDLESIAKLLASLDYFKEQKYKVIILLSVGCGLRISELIGLKKDDVNAKTHTLNISKQYKYLIDNDGKFKPGLGITKSESSKRKNKIPVFVQEELYQYMDTIPDGWLFPGKRISNPISGTSIRYHLTEFCDAIGLRRLTPHDMRRIYTTISIYAGINISTISSTLGHSNVLMTMLYQRKLSAVDKQSSEKMDDFVKNTIKKQENE